MIARTSDLKAGGLRETVAVLNETASRAGSLPIARAQLVERWKTAVSSFFDRIETVYLIEFLIFGTIVPFRGCRSSFVPGFGSQEIDCLELRIGDVSVEFTAGLDVSSGVASVNAYAGSTDFATEFTLDVTNADAPWLVVAREQGLRRLIERYLPLTMVEVNEATFKRELDIILIGEQPVFNLRRAGVQLNLSRLLDHVTSDAVRRSLSLQVKDRIDGVRTTLALGAPRIRDVPVARLESGKDQARFQIESPEATKRRLG